MHYSSDMNTETSAVPYYLRARRSVESPKQMMLAGDARYMADIIRRVRAAYAAAPQCARDVIVRRAEDGAAQAAAEIRSAAAVVRGGGR